MVGFPHLCFDDLFRLLAALFILVVTGKIVFDDVRAIRGNGIGGKDSRYLFDDRIDLEAHQAEPLRPGDLTEAAIDIGTV